MKKLLFLLLLASQIGTAQEALLLNKNNEFRVNALSLIASSKLNISYERFLNKNFSMGLTTSYSDSKKVNDDFDAGYRNTFPKYEIVPFVRYNLSKSLSRFYFAEVFMSANGGDYKQTVRLTEGNYGYYAIQKDTYFDLALGGGLGYKMYFKEQFAVEFLVGFGTNIIDKNKSPDVISRVGLNFGYRF